MSKINFSEDNESDYYEDNIFNYNVSPDEIKNHFSFLFMNVSPTNARSSKRMLSKNANNALKGINKMKDNQDTLKKYIAMRKASHKSPKKTTKTLPKIIENNENYSP